MEAHHFQGVVIFNSRTSLTAVDQGVEQRIECGLESAAKVCVGPPDREGPRVDAGSRHDSHKFNAAVVGTPLRRGVGIDRFCIP
jgi:hypothetical protein